MDTEGLNRLVAELRSVRADTHSVEVKSAVGKLPKSLAETLSAFSNSAGGTVILGLDEGTDFRPALGFDALRTREALARACADDIYPPVRSVIEILPFEGAQVVVTEVPEISPLSGDADQASDDEALRSSAGHQHVADQPCGQAENDPRENARNDSLVSDVCEMEARWRAADPAAYCPWTDWCRSRRMIRRSWVIRAVPAAAITSAPAMAASSRATASDRCRWAPRKLMLTAFAFWMTKISTTANAAMPMISAVRMLLTLVRSPVRGGTWGMGGAEPLADGSGKVLGVPVGAAAAVMESSFKAGPEPVPATRWCWPPAAADSRCLFSTYIGNYKLATYFRN
jgi:hypothetical protein